MNEKKREALANELKRLGARGTLIQMARAGQLLEVRCEMPFCYREKGRTGFADRSANSRDWMISFDHHPRLASDGGHYEAGNARIGHIYCNNVDYGWRSRVRALLNKGKSLEQIAKTLNDKAIPAPPRRSEWTATLVRKAQTS